MVRFTPRIVEFLGYTPLPTPDSLPERLKTCRLALGLSYKKLAKLVGLDEGSLRRWESGGTVPNKKSLQILGRFLTEETNT